LKTEIERKERVPLENLRKRHIACYTMPCWCYFFCPRHMFLDVVAVKKEVK